MKLSLHYQTVSLCIQKGMIARHILHLSIFTQVMINYWKENVVLVFNKNAFKHYSFSMLNLRLFNVAQLMKITPNWKHQSFSGNSSSKLPTSLKMIICQAKVLDCYGPSQTVDIIKNMFIWTCSNHPVIQAHIKVCGNSAE